MKRPGLVINGVEVPDGPRRRPPAPAPRPRCFDHLDGCPEDERFSAVAHAMHGSRWWLTVPEWTEPAAVSGEIDRVGRDVDATRAALRTGAMRIGPRR